MTRGSSCGSCSRLAGRTRVCTMASLTWPSHDFSRASTWEVEIAGLTRANLLRFCSVSSSRWARTPALPLVLPIRSPVTAERMIVLPAAVGATPRVLSYLSSAQRLRSTNTFCLGRSSVGLALLRPSRPDARLALRRLLGSGWRRTAGGRRRGGDGPHELRVVPVVWRHCGADFVLIVAEGIGADVDPGDELQAIEIGKAADAPGSLSLRRLVLVGDATGRVQHAADQTTAHVGPLRSLRAVEADQREDFAPGVRPLQDGELAVQIDRPGRAVGCIAAGPSLAGIVVAARTDGEPNFGKCAFRDEVAVALGVVEIVPGSGHHGPAPFR